MIILIFAIFLAYLLGSIPISYLIAKGLKGVDIRKHGSGNVGATNVLRTLGKAPAITALALDAIKGVIAVTLLSNIFYRYSSIIDYESLRILMGLAAICGHIWPIFLKFKGGKGVATSAGVLLILAPKVLGIALLIWFIMILITRYVSLGSVLASISLPITAAFMAKPLNLVLFCITLAIMCTYRHKLNIVKLINGEESKIGQKTKKA